MEGNLEKGLIEEAQLPLLFLLPLLVGLALARRDLV
jgi:hypothetical protein